MTNLSTRLAQLGVIGAAYLVGVQSLAAQDTAATKSDSAAGYRSMSRSDSMSPADSSRSDSSTANATTRTGKSATRTRHARARGRKATTRDSTKWGYRVDTTGKAQNPAGYRGMERPANVLPSDSSGKADSTAPADATSRIHQRARQDSSSASGQNPPGYRGMERPAALDSAQNQSRADTIGRDSSSQPSDTSR
jgi:hypothetical protein